VASTKTAGLTGDLNLTQTSHRWIIQGAGTSTIIDASQLQDRVFQIVNSGTQVVFQDLVIQGGLAQDDGSDGAQAGTTDALGGGILNNGGDVTLEDVVIQSNVARAGDAINFGHAGYNARGGGLYSTGGALTIARSTLAANQANAGIGGPTTYSFIGPGGNAQGGGLYATGGLLTFVDSAATANTLRGGEQGGASQGGGLYVEGTSVVSNSTIADNTLNQGFSGPTYGGGLYAGGTLVISNSTINANALFGATAYGGGVYVLGTVTISNSPVLGNTVRGGDGHPIYEAGGSDGWPAYGGGLYVAGTLTVNNSTVAGNTTQGGAGGEAYYFDHPGGNGAAGQGGALLVAPSATAQVSFSTIANNQAMGGQRGGGFPNGLPGSGIGGGLYSQGMLQSEDTIVAGNVVAGPGTNSSPDLAGNLGSLGYNLIGNTQGGAGFNPSDLRNVDPLLGSLQDNGGPTETMALLRGSLALNAGDPSQLGVPDQRGVVRSGGVNIGAYQASATAFLVSAPDMVQSGVPFDVTVTAMDPFNQVAAGYTGTITFSTNDPDPGVVLPADYTFTLADGGVHTFTDTALGETTLITPGPQTLTVMDTADNTITGSAIVTGNSGPEPTPHGQGPPTNTLQPSPAQAEPPPAREPPHQEAIAIDRWFISFHDRDDAWLTLPQLRHQGQDATDAWLPDPFALEEGPLGSVW
jgi:hypothetical protein